MRKVKPGVGAGYQQFMQERHHKSVLTKLR